jgi:hypothetical protein
MANPITGPIIEEQIDGGNSPSGEYRPAVYWKRIERYRQMKPYDRPLPYVHQRAHVSYSSESVYDYVEYYQTEAYRRVHTEGSWNNALVSGAYNKAYDRFLSRLKEDTAELGAGLAEYRKTADMVSDRAVQLYRFMRAVKRGRFGEANSLLRVPSNFRPKARGLGGVVLEYSFGWAPTVGDIHNGMKILSNGCPPTWAHASAKDYQDFNLAGPYPYPYRRSEKGRVSVVVRVGAVVNLSNPNLWLLNQLGLINPAGIAWELVPFSFVLDYFGNVGNVINSWTDTLGLSLGGVYRSWGLESVSSGLQEEGIIPPGYPREGQLTTLHWGGDAYRLVRETPNVLPGPTLRWNAPKVSLRRASTSIALLLQLLKG